MPFRNTAIADLLLDPEDFEYLVSLKVKPSFNAGRGAYFCEGRKKVYVHRLLLQYEGFEMRGYRVGFLDGLQNNCCKRNLFRYEITSNPLLSKRAAWEKAAERAKQNGFVIY